MLTFKTLTIHKALRSLSVITMVAVLLSLAWIGIAQLLTPKAAPLWSRYLQPQAQQTAEFETVRDLHQRARRS